MRIGMGIDAYIDPFSYLASAKGMDEMQITRFVLGGIDERARAIDVLDELEKNSLDFYAQLRSLSQQRRAAELRRGAGDRSPAPISTTTREGAAPKHTRRQRPADAGGSRKRSARP